MFAKNEIRDFFQSKGLPEVIRLKLILIDVKYLLGKSKFMRDESLSKAITTNLFESKTRVATASAPAKQGRKVDVARSSPWIEV